MRYPGGSYSDIFNWQTNTAADGGFVAPNTTFANFMTTAQGVGAAPIVTVNYGTGTPSLAAAWVTSAKTNGDNVKYWEVGNEVYGNGTYGANWEADSHCDTSAGGSPVTIGSEPSQTFDCGPSTYAKNFLAVPVGHASRGLDRQGVRRAHHPWLLAGRRHELAVPAVLEPDRTDRARLAHPVRDRALLPGRL